MTEKEAFMAGFAAAFEYLSADEAWSNRAAKKASGVMGAEAFTKAVGNALCKAKAVLGSKWYLSGHTVLIQIPAKLAQYKTERGTVIRMRREMRVPKPEYWPGGCIPAGVKVFEDYPQSNGLVLCLPNGDRTEAYDDWLKERLETCPVYDISGREIEERLETCPVYDISGREIGQCSA